MEIAISNLGPIIFFLLIIIFVILFIYLFFTKRGQNISVDLITGSKGSQVIGEIPETEFKTFLGIKIKQKLKIYKYNKDGKTIYILESTQSNLGSITRYWVKLTPEIISSIKSLLEN